MATTTTSRVMAAVMTMVQIMRFRLRKMGTVAPLIKLTAHLQGFRFMAA
jgi:hypothetical protein